MKFCSVCGHPVLIYPSTSGTGLLAPNHLLKQRYRIQRRLGQGGMGAVYQAEDTLFNNATRAVKELSQSGLNPQELQEATTGFKQEAMLLAGLMHPQLPRIYDYFEEKDRWYLVMDFIAGETLEAWLEQKPNGKLPPEEVVDIGSKLCSVLHYLHTRQPPIIFRDLKPANVMLTAEGDLYLIDFGIARLFKPGQTKDTLVLGSPGYAAPEQYGKAQTSASADIYSLGATLHQLLSGRDPTQQPFQFPVLDLGPQPASSALAELVHRMVEMNQDQRPASMQEVKQELQRLRGQLATGSVGLGPPFQASHPTTVQSGHPAPASPQRPMSATITPHPHIGTLLVTCQGHTSTVLDVAWAPAGMRLASASNDQSVRVWEAVSGWPVITCLGHTHRVNGVAWAPDSTRLVSASSDRTVRVWDAASGRLLVTSMGHIDGVNSVAWAPDGIRLASASDDQTVRVWEAASGQLLVTSMGHTDWVNGVAWAPDGRLLASASSDRTVRIWDAATGVPLVTCQGHTNGVNSVAWAPDGTRLASASSDRTVRIWDVHSGRLHVTCQKHTGTVHSVAWAPDGTRLASASDDQTVRVWQAYGGRLIFTYQWHTNGVNSVAWAPDGTRLASTSDDKTVQIWSAE